MHLSQYYGITNHLYLSHVNLVQQDNFPAIINLLLQNNNSLSHFLKLKIIESMKDEEIQKGFDFSRNHSELGSIFHALLINEGAWSNSFSQKEQAQGIIEQTKRIEQLDELFLYLYKKQPCDLYEQKFLDTSNMLAALLIHELPLSLDYALQNTSEENKKSFFNYSKIDFRYNDNMKKSLFFNIFHNDSRKVIEVLIRHGFDLNFVDHNNESIGFYLKSKELTEHLIEKGFLFDLNHYNGVSKLKDFINIKNCSMDYDSSFLGFVQTLKSQLPIDPEDIFLELKDSFDNDSISIFKKNFQSFYKYTGNSIYKDIGITDIMLLHLVKDFYYHDHIHSIHNFFKKEIPSFPNELEHLYKSIILCDNKAINAGFTNKEIIAFIDRIGHFMDIYHEHFSVPEMIFNIGSLFLPRILNMATTDNLLVSLNDKQLLTLGDILLLHDRNIKPTDHYYGFYKDFIKEVQKKSLDHPVLKIMNHMVILKDKKSFSENIELFNLLDQKYINFIHKNETCINQAIQNYSQKETELMDSFISASKEKQKIVESMDKSNSENNIKKRL